MNVIVVDDQRSARRVLVEHLESLGDFQVSEASSPAEAARLVEETRFDLAFVDLRLSDDVRDRQGLEVARKLRDECGALTVIVTGLSDIAEMRAAMRLGVFDYVLKEHLSPEQVGSVLAEARNRLNLEREVLAHRAQNGADVTLGMIGSSVTMERLRGVIRRVALSDRPVLVTGPSGSGKEVVVRSIHRLGPSPQSPLMELNCGALPEHLVESQLFGHERGAFTGADKRLPGLLAAVGPGTLFLDEVAEMPLTQQPKLLRVLEARRYRSVGGSVEQVFQGRVVAATHADLEERVAQGRFREDLFHRLAVLRVRVPSLAERREDIPSLLAHFARQSSPTLTFSSEAIDWLTARPWTGQVRELRNLVDQTAVMLDERPVSRASLETLVAPGRPPPWLRLAQEVLAAQADGDKLDLMEMTLVTEALRLADGNKSAAARMLGVHRKRIERRAGLADSDQGDG